ncbi:glycosyltransferase family 39 protein [Candidatus Gottesmanbacteria bacterium]|nr:glycosyltransferase family 39 protein [Candidatus Gottesmanbacteria bacterium]
MEKVSQKSKVNPSARLRMTLSEVEWVKSQKFWNISWPDLLMIVILLLAAYLRLYNISGYMTFLGDEGRDALVVKQMIVDHKWTLLGPTASVGGFFLGPVYYYFMLPFLWAWRLDPTGPAVMVALFGIATVYLVYRAGREMYGAWVGLASSALYALSPVVIAYSRSSWNPNIVPFFSLMTIYLLWKFAQDGKRRYVIGAGVCMGIGLQLHYLFLFLFPVAIVWILMYAGVRKRIKSIVFGLTGFLAGYAPFLLFELRHGFPNTQSIVQFVLAGKDTSLAGEKYRIIIQDILFRLVGRLILRLPQPETWARIPQWQQGIWQWGIVGLLIAGIGVLLIRAHPARPAASRSASRILLLWGIVVAGMFGFYKRAIYDYYFGIWFTLPFLVTGLVLQGLKQMRWIGFMGSLALLAWLLWWNWKGQPFQYPPNNQLAQARSIAREAYDKTGGKPYNFALVTQGNSDHVYRYFFEIWGNPPTVIEPEFKDPERKTVTDQLIVICEVPQCKPLGHPLWEIAGFGAATISGTWNNPFVTIHKLVHL